MTNTTVQGATTQEGIRIAIAPMVGIVHLVPAAGSSVQVPGIGLAK